MKIRANSIDIEVEDTGPGSAGEDRPAVLLIMGLGIDKAHVVGVSMGGMIAQRVALAAPARTLSLTSMLSTSGARGLPQARPEVMRAMYSRPAQLPRITVPTLVVHGKADPLVPYACAEDTARRIPGAKLVGIEGMGHDLPPGVVERLLASLIPHLKTADARTLSNAQA